AVRRKRYQDPAHRRAPAGRGHPRSRHRAWLRPDHHGLAWPQGCEPLDAGQPDGRSGGDDDDSSAGHSLGLNRYSALSAAVETLLLDPGNKSRGDRAVGGHRIAPLARQVSLTDRTTLAAFEFPFGLQ